MTPENGVTHLSETRSLRRRVRYWRKSQRRLRRYRPYALDNAQDETSPPADPGPFELRVEPTRAGGLEVGTLGAGPTVVALASLGQAGTERFGPLATALAQAGFRTLAVNLRGPMLGCKHAIPELCKRGGGAIINTSSASGLVGDLARPAYGSSKAGVDSLTRYVATQYGKQGIRCNAIAPGVIETPALKANITPEQVELYKGNHLTPRLGRPEDIAGMVVFLASDAGAYVTGQILSVDGGLLSHHPTYAEFNKLGAG